MAHGTTEQETAPEQPLPPDIETMRASARRANTEDAELPPPDELDTLALALRGHIQLLIPEVAMAAARQPKDSIPRYCALACIGEARACTAGAARPRTYPCRNGKDILLLPRCRCTCHTGTASTP